MKRRGFTMIELVFIIVILGILGAIAVPKMAASRNDAKAVAIKSDIGTITQALPAMAMSQNNAKEITFANAVSVNEGNWGKSSTGKMIWSKLKDDGSSTKPATPPNAVDTGTGACVTIKILQAGTGTGNTTNPKVEDGVWYLNVVHAAGDNLCKRIGTAGTQNIPLTGRGVSFN